MRIDFDHKTPLAEQFTRAGNRKKVGRKHDKRLGPTRMGARRDGKSKFAGVIRAKFAKFKREVRRYWTGERAEHPGSGPS